MELEIIKKYINSYKDENDLPSIFIDTNKKAVDVFINALKSPEIVALLNEHRINIRVENQDSYYQGCKRMRRVRIRMLRERENALS